LQNPWELRESEHAGTTQGTNSNAPGASGAPSHQKGVGISGETVEAQPGQVGEGSSKSVESNLAQAGSLEQELQIQQSAFNDAMTARDADGAVRACLALEPAIHDWSADTLQGDIADKARAAVRSMISALGDAAIGGVRNPRDVVAPYVEAMLAIRATVRAEKRYDLSDVIRDAFVNIGIEVRDTATGVEWDL
jgi:cysteinyl-tRNA synthetase